MFGRLFARQVVTLLLAFGIFLGGAASGVAVPGMAGHGSMPARMAMPGMTMQNDCAAAPVKCDSNKTAPCKCADCGCTVRASCALGITVIQESAPSPLFDSGDAAIFAHDANRNGIAVMPALRPPIFGA